MSDFGSVELSVKLGLGQLQQQIEEAKRRLQAIPDVELKFAQGGSAQAAQGLREVSKAADELFRTQAALTKQRVKEALQEQASAAKIKAQADKEAAKSLNDLFNEQAKFERSRTQDVLKQQAAAAREKSLADRQAAKDADAFARAIDQLGKQAASNELKAQAQASREKAIADRQATKEAEALFRTNAALSKQRVSEELKAQAAAAREKAQADALAAKQADQLFRTNAALSQQKVAEELKAQAIQARAAAEAEQKLLEVKLAQAKAAAVGTSRDSAQRMVVQQIQEEIRFRKELAAIAGKGFNERDAANARQLAAELNRINLGRIEQDFDRGRKSAVKFFEEIQRGVARGIGQSAVQLGVDGLVNAAQAGVGAIAGAVSKGVGTFVEFQGAITDFGAKSRGTEAEIKALADEAKRLGVVTSKGPVEIGQAAVAMTTLGLSAKETTKELEGVVRLSEASGEGLEISAKVVQSASQLFQSSAIETANIVAATANTSAASTEDFLQILSKGAPIAKENNQSFQSLAATFGLLRNAGFSAETAATAYKIVLDRLSSPTAKANAALKDLNKALAANGQKTIELRGPDKQLKDFLTLVPEFKAALANLDPDQRANLTKTLFGSEGGPAFLSLLATTQDKIDEATASVNKANDGQGAAFETSQKRLEGLTGALKLIGGSAETLGVQFGDALEPALEGATRFANDILVNLLKSTDTFGPLNAAAQDFANYLAENPEIAERISAGLSEAFQVLGTEALSAVRSLTDTLAENPQLISELVGGTVKFVELLGKAAGFALQIAERVGEGVNELSILEGGGGEVEGSRRRTKEQGISNADFNDAFRENLRKQGVAVPDALATEEDIANDKKRDPLGLQFLDPKLKEKQARIAEETANQLLQQRKLPKGSGGLSADIATAKPEDSGFSIGKDKDGATSGGGVKGLGQVVGSPETKKTFRIENSKDAEKAKKKEISEALQDITKLENQAQASEDRQTAIAKQALLSRKVSREDAQRQILAAEISGTNARIAAIGQGLAQINELEKSGKLSKGDADQKRAELSKKQADLEKQLVEQRLRAQEEADRRAVESFERANQAQTAAIATTQTRAVRAIRARQLEGVIGEKDAAIEIAKAQAETTKATLAQKQQELAGLQKLRAQGVLDQKEFGQKELAARQEIESLQTQAVEQALQNQQAIKLRAIEVETNAQKQAIQQVINGLEAQKGAYDTLTKRQENLTKLAQSRAALEKQVAAIAIAGSQSSIDRINESIEASKRLKEGGADLNPGVRRVLEFQQASGLEGTGLSANSSELDVLKKKLALEDELSQKKRDALIAEQNATTALLRIDLQRQQIAAQQSLIEAQIASNRADQSVAEASAGVKTAQVSGNPEQVAAAIAQLQTAQLGQALSRQNVGLAQQNVAVQGQLASDALKADTLKNQSELGAFDDAERKRRLSSAMAIAEGGGSLNDVNAALQRVGGPISTASAQAQGLAQQAAAQGPNLGALIQEGNNAVVGRLDTMIKSLQDAIAVPKQVTINGSKAPAQDAAKLLTEVNQAKAVRAGV